MSDRPHEHYLLDEVAHKMWAVVCATCETAYGEGEGVVALVESPLDYPAVAEFHWREVFEHGRPRATS